MNEPNVPGCEMGCEYLVFLEGKCKQYREERDGLRTKNTRIWAVNKELKRVISYHETEIHSAEKRIELFKVALREIRELTKEYPSAFKTSNGNMIGDIIDRVLKEINK